jgi:hypothetical protein
MDQQHQFLDLSASEAQLVEQPPVLGLSRFFGPDLILIWYENKKSDTDTDLIFQKGQNLILIWYWSDIRYQISKSDIKLIITSIILPSFIKAKMGENIHTIVFLPKRKNQNQTKFIAFPQSTFNQSITLIINTCGISYKGAFILPRVTGHGSRGRDPVSRGSRRFFRALNGLISKSTPLNTMEVIKKPQQCSAADFSLTRWSRPAGQVYYVWPAGHRPAGHGKNRCLITKYRELAFASQEKVVEQGRFT